MCSSLISLLNVVKRPFKSGGQFYAVGTVIEDPTALRLFKQKVADGKILLVTEQNLESTIHYFTVKHDLPDFGKDITAALEKVKPKPVKTPAPEKK